MLHADDIDELEAKRICHGCVAEPYLSAEVKRTGEQAKCDYCGETAQCWSIGDLAEHIEKAFEDHYTRTSDQPDSWQERMLADKESDYVWYREGDPVIDAIEGAAEIPRTAAEDVLEILADKHGDFDSAAMGEETEFSSDACYEEKGTSTDAWQQEWHWFEQSLKTEARFFSRDAAAHLASVFGGIDKLKTSSGRRLIVEAGPRRALNHLYRARVFQADDKLTEALCRPDLQLGSPPARLASAGRMNACGISVFYGATSARAAVAEVRPPVGSKAAVAKFAIVRPLLLLDLTALETATDSGSIFDPTLKDRLERAAFLRSLGQLMTRPVMPDDEAFDYLATQAVADFLATENAPALDGIIYRSVQVKGGRNVVLLHKAARVEELPLPNGTTIEASTCGDTEDEPCLDYWVREVVPAAAPSLANEEHDRRGGLLSSEPLDFDRWDFREVALRVDPASVEVHRIHWVNYRSAKHAVTRHRFKERMPDF